MINRHDCLDRLVSVMGNGAVKIITGIRRCGKSYLLNTIFRAYLKKQGVRNDHIVAVALDLDEFEELQNPRKPSAYVKKRLKSDGKTNYVFIDEIQLCHKVLKEGVAIEEIAPEDRDSVWLTFYDVLNSLDSQKC